MRRVNQKPQCKPTRRKRGPTKPTKPTINPKRLHLTAKRTIFQPTVFSPTISHTTISYTKNLVHESISSNDLLPSAHSTTGSDNQNNDTTYFPSGTMDLVGYMETAERLNQLNNINHLNRSNHQLHQTAAHQNPQQNTHLPPHPKRKPNPTKSRTKPRKPLTSKQR